jgi:glucoamylase
MVRKACGFLMREGPATNQERWEEAAGYSPSTLAINVAGLICAAELLDAAGDADAARFVREYADFVESHIESWTVTTQGSLVPGVERHYIRINGNTTGGEDPNTATVILANQQPGDR